MIKPSLHMPNNVTCLVLQFVYPVGPYLSQADVEDLSHELYQLKRLLQRSDQQKLFLKRSDFNEISLVLLSAPMALVYSSRQYSRVRTQFSCMKLVKSYKNSVCDSG